MIWWETKCLASSGPDGGERDFLLLPLEQVALLLKSLLLYGRNDRSTKEHKETSLQLSGQQRINTRGNKIVTP